MLLGLADPNPIQQALLNLCVNARDAMPEGGKLLLQSSIARGAELRRRFQQAKEEQYVCIRVSDTGIGIDERTRSRMFEPFFTTTPSGQGTGLGLSIVYGIVTNHTGFVDVDSEPNEGSSLRIYLPLLRERVELIEAAPKMGTIKKTGSRDVEARNAYFRLARAFTRASSAGALKVPRFPLDANDITVEKLVGYRKKLAGKNKLFGKSVLDDVENWTFGGPASEGEPLHIKFKDYVFLQRLSSALRTALSKDLRSRRRPS